MDIKQQLDMLEQRIKTLSKQFVRDDAANMMVWKGDIKIYEKMINTNRSDWITGLSLPFKIVFLYDEIADGTEGYVAIGVD
jgi:hypothetical protein